MLKEELKVELGHMFEQLKQEMSCGQRSSWSFSGKFATGCVYSRINLQGQGAQRRNA